VAARRFYNDALDAAEQSELTQALGIDGIDEEIAVLRLRLRRFIEEHPEDLPLMFRGIELLTKAVATRYRLSKDDKTALQGEVAGTLRVFTEDMLAGGTPRE
jgi:hypothetical protein